MNNFERDKQLFPEDITGAGQTSESVREDILNVLGYSPTEEETGGVRDQIQEAQAFLRDVSFGVLGRLDEKGIEGASELSARLEDIDPNNPLNVDLSAVSAALDEERISETDPDKCKELKDLGSLAYSIFSVVTVMGVAAAKGPSKETLSLFGVSCEAVENAEIPDETREELLGILEEVDSVLSPPPEETK